MPTKRELKLIAFSAVFLLFIAGCGSGEVTTGAPTTPFLGGDQSLEISFLEGNPPAEVTDGGTFPFKAVVSLKNVGEHNIAKDQINVSLIGFLPSQFNLVSPNNFDEKKLKNRNALDDLSGRQRDAEGNIIEPVESFLEFPEETSKNFNFKDQIAGNNIFIFRAEACYKYLTKVKSDICILQSQIDVVEGAICKPSEAKAVFSSGSPIKVTSFRQNIAGSNKLQLSFDVEHSGTGNIFDPTITANCPRDQTGRRAVEDQVIINVSTGLAIPTTTPAAAGYQLKCVGLNDVAGAATAKQSGKVKIINGKRTITCTLDMPTERTDFIKPVDIIIDFNYAQNADKEVLVKHIITNP